MSRPFVFSIRPAFVDAFREGRKRWEFRTRRPSIEAGERHLIYETSPVSKIVAVARIGRVLAKSPGQIWDICGAEGGVSRQVFDLYFSTPCKVCGGRGVDPLKPVGGRPIDFGCDACEGSGSAGPRFVAVAIEMRMEWLERPLALPPGMHAPQSWARWRGPWPMGDGEPEATQLALVLE